MARLAQKLAGCLQPGQKAYKKGGIVKHDDEAQDKALIAKMIKKEDKKEMKKGGKCK